MSLKIRDPLKYAMRLRCCTLRCCEINTRALYTNTHERTRTLYFVVMKIIIYFIALMRVDDDYMLLLLIQHMWPGGVH